MSPCLKSAAGRKNQKSKKLKKIREKLKNALSLRKIEKYLASSKTYIGAFHLDSFKKLLVKMKRFSAIFYCNFHWFCVYSTEKTFEIFDPLGFLQKSKCLTKKFFKFIKTFITGKIFHSNPQIQSNDSFLCGYYVIFYIYMRDMGHSFSDILRKFSHNLKNNDNFVYKCVRKMFKK